MHVVPDFHELDLGKYLPEEPRPNRCYKVWSTVTHPHNDKRTLYEERTSVSYYRKSEAQRQAKLRFRDLKRLWWKCKIEVMVWDVNIEGCFPMG